jgi:VanZ family protein
MENEQPGFAGSVTRSSPVKFWIPTCCLAVLILVLSSTPGAYYPDHPEYMNNVVHFMEFGLLSFLLSRTFFRGYALGSVSLFLWAVLICVSFSLLDEMHQFLVPERMFEFQDLVFDSLGAVTGSGVYILSRSLKSDRSGARSSAPSGDLND